MAPSELFRDGLWVLMGVYPSCNQWLLLRNVRWLRVCQQHVGRNPVPSAITSKTVASLVATENVAMEPQNSY